jgi:hypothetical protein
MRNGATHSPALSIAYSPHGNRTALAVSHAVVVINSDGVILIEPLPTVARIVPS